MEGEKGDFEVKISELEWRESTTTQQLGELKARVEYFLAHKGFLENQLKIANEKKLDIMPSCDQACKIWRKIHQVQVNLLGKIYKVKLAETRLNEIAVESLSLRKQLIKVFENVQIQLT